MSDFGHLVESKFDAVVSGFDSVNYLDAEALAGFFDSAAACLRGRGIIVFDYSSKKLLEHDWRGEEYDQNVDELTLRWRHLFDEELARSETHLKLMSNDGGAVWEETHYQYSLDPYRIASLGGRFNLHLIHLRNLDSVTYSPLANTNVYLFQRG